MGWILQLHPLPPRMREVLKTSQRACTVRPYLGWKPHETPLSEYCNSTPSPHGWKRYLKQVRGPAHWELVLVRSTMEWILQLHPLPPQMREVFKTSQRACTVWAYLGWKHHEAPWGEYYNSTPSPHGWERYLKQARGPAQWELILVRSTMKHHEAPWGEYYNSTPSSHGWDRYLRQARGPVQWELILVGSTMKHHGVNITTPPPPPMDGRGT